MRAEILVFDGFEDLDAFGPMNVLAVAGFEVRLVTGGPSSPASAPVTSALGTRVVPAGPLTPGVDLLIVPGGGWLSRAPAGAWAEAQRGELPRVLAEAAAAGSVIASVCTGALLLGAAGLLKGRPAVTHAGALGDLPGFGALPDRTSRVVDDGDIVTSGGLTAGLDLGLWLVERLSGRVRAAEVARRLEYVRQGAVRRSVTELPELLQQVGELQLPQTALAVAALAAAREAEPEYLFNHSVRSYLFARLCAGARAMSAAADYDDELLFAACVLHDLGLTAGADTGARFEVDGADAAVELLRNHGASPERSLRVWDAIALHTSAGIAERKQPEVALTRAGIAMDLGVGAEIVPNPTAEAIHAALPRLELARRLADDIVRQAHGRPDKAPPASLPAEVLRQRSTPGHISFIERAAAAGRWGG